MAFICGSFHSQEKDDYDVLCPCDYASPRKPARKRNVFGRSSKTATNPYSDRGLDKFEALLADLDHKRQKILTQKGSEDVSMVKFIYRTPDEVKPVIVKFQDRRKHVNMSSLESTPEREHKKDVDAFVKGNNGGNGTEEGKREKPFVFESKINKIKFDQWRKKFEEWWKPSYYFPLFVILILVLLMFSGRSFAILCISIGWYFVPVINETLHNSRQSNKITKRRVLEKVEITR